MFVVTNGGYCWWKVRPSAAHVLWRQIQVFLTRLWAIYSWLCGNQKRGFKPDHDVLLNLTKGFLCLDLSRAQAQEIENWTLKVQFVRPFIFETHSQLLKVKSCNVKKRLFWWLSWFAPPHINAMTRQRSYLILYCETYHPISCANGNKSTNLWHKILYNNRIRTKCKKERTKQSERSTKKSKQTQIIFKKGKLLAASDAKNILSSFMIKLNINKYALFTFIIIAFFF